MQDTDGDERITLKELRDSKMLGQALGAARLGDAGANLNKVRNARDIFNTIDADADGAIVEEEVVAWYSQMHAAAKHSAARDGPRSARAAPPSTLLAEESQKSKRVKMPERYE